MSEQFHVVLGAGPGGLSTARELHGRGHEVLVLSRSEVDPGALPAGVRTRTGDVTEPGLVARVAEGATAIYNATHAPYPVWDTVLPALQEAALTGARDTGARLVVLDTLYPYGPTGGKPMTEDTPNAATSHKGKLRIRLTERYLGADVPVAIGRAADFFGPGVLTSVLGGTVFPAALTGEPVLGMGRIDLPHAYTYIGDVGRGLATLGERPDAAGRVWLLPTVPAVSTERIHELIAAELGAPLRIDRLPELKPYGPFDESFIREYSELFYQYQEAQIVDSGAIERAFGLTPTPLPEALRHTIEWYRALLSQPRMAAASSSPSSGVAAATPDQR